MLFVVLISTWLFLLRSLTRDRPEEDDAKGEMQDRLDPPRSRIATRTVRFREPYRSRSNSIELEDFSGLDLRSQNSAFHNGVAMQYRKYPM